MIHLCAYIPFYHSITAVYPNIDGYWLWLVIPLAIAVSVVYKGTRVEHLRDVGKEALVMSVQLIAVMALAAVILAAGYWGYVHWVGPTPM